jgi:hypothetical protein
MKAILKTIPSETDMNYDEKYCSIVNVEIRRKLIPELRKALKPTHRVSYDQIDAWLKSLHRSRRSRYNLKKSGKLDKDNRRIHASNRCGVV